MGKASGCGETNVARADDRNCAHVYALVAGFMRQVVVGTTEILTRSRCFAVACRVANWVRDLIGANSKLPTADSERLGGRRRFRRGYCGYC